jgi:hypothetical protein
MPPVRDDSPKKGGRPSRYRAEFAEQAFNLCLLGATDADLARAFDVSEQTVNAWKQAHPAFLESLKKGKEQADARVARSLFRRATGYSHKAVKIVADAKTGQEHIVPYVERYPPDTTAAIFWLKNRRPEQWRDKQQLEHSGGIGAPGEFDDVTNDDLKAQVAALMERLP